MKRLQWKNIIFSFLAIIAISVFITSCGTETNEIDKKLELSDADLVEMLTTNTSFIASVEIMNKMTADFNTFIEANQSLIERDATVFDNYISEYSEHKEAFIAHSNQLVNEIPLLEQREKEEATVILSNAFELVNEASVSLRNPCIHACDHDFTHCNADAYSEYLFTVNYCVNSGEGNFNYCNNLYYGYYLEAHGICVSFRNYCISQC